ncbi:MAG: UDP-N-acetylmuramate dehydrogenase [Candidatus Omnitrophota bacterium]|nr:UDP-N-acetylmuramate dehydrogenase [Candidatus Omnitrophota bacterium]
MHWPKSLKIKTGVKLSGYTTFKIGGPARFFLKPNNLKELQDALIFAKNKHIKVFILGAGSNILVSDSGLDGLVIWLNAAYFKGLRFNRENIQAGCGLKLNQLLIGAKNKSLSGVEFLAGIPGTLGAAIIGNAGAWGESIGELVSEVQVLDYNGRARLLKKSQLKFSYRKSNLRKYIILSAKLKLVPAPQREIEYKVNQLLRQRSKTQENNLPNAGCIFKNPAKYFAGKLIEDCGLKARACGRAVISAKHANFILNKGKAKSKDVLSLMYLMRKEVKRRFRVNLEPEIKIWK